MSKKNILADAIADAKAIKEAALANAKAAIAETFTPTLKSLISAELQEELEEDLDEGDGFTGGKKTHGKNVGYKNVKGVNEADGDDDDDDKMDEAKKDDNAKEEGGDGKEEIDESSDLDALLKELESDDDADDEVNEKDDAYNKKVGGVGPNKYAAPDYDANKDDQDKITPMDEKGDEGGEEKDSKDSDYELYLQLKKKFEPKPNEKPKDEAEGGSEEGDDEGFDIESIIRELESEAKGQGYAMDDGDDDGEEMGEAKYAAPDKNANKDNKDKITPMDEKVQDELKELAQVRKELNEVNLMNAKLLYFGKVIKEQDNLSKSEKVGILKQFDKAATVKEAKLIYGTITESLKTNKSKKNTKQLKENLGFSSKAAGSAPKKSNSSEPSLVNEETVNRFRFLAGLNKAE